MNDSNNAGAQWLNNGGQVEQAHQLFRAALNDYLRHAALRTPSTDHPFSNLIVTQNKSALLLQESGSCDHKLSLSCPSANQPGHPVVYSHAFKINPGHYELHSSVAIIFNLALVHQLQDRSSWKAKVFYEIANIIMAILGETGTNAQVYQATVNNLGVWMYDNHCPLDANALFLESVVSATRSNINNMQNVPTSINACETYVSNLVHSMTTTTKHSTRPVTSDQS